MLSSGFKYRARQWWKAPIITYKKTQMFDVFFAFIMGFALAYWGLK